jgi:GTPase SAR1 family protein
MADNYQEILDQIEQVRNALGKDAHKLNLPQITVIGDQSSGKSSLLSEVSGIPFPTNSGITTKCPIKVYTKCNKEIDKTKYVIIKDGIREHISHDKLSDKILELQKEILGTNKVVKTPITIEAEGKNLKDIVLIDLPGIIANGEGQEDVLEMIKEYISPEESLILIVTEARQDDENARALELAKKFDNDGLRSIRVLTKCDVFDSPEHKIKVLNIFKQSSDELPSHAVVCRLVKKYDREHEKKCLEGMPTTRAGIKNLKERLPSLLCELIQKNLPGLKIQIDKSIKENTEKLNIIGEEPPDNTRILLDIQSNFKKNIEDMEISLTDPIKDFSEKIRESKKFITEDVIKEYYQYNAFETIFFQGGKTFNKILMFLNKEWKNYIDELIPEISSVIDNLFDIHSIKNISTKLRNTILNNWEEYCKEIIKEVQKTMDFELKKCERSHTMNHYLTAKYEENMILPEEIIEKITNNISEDTLTYKDISGRKLYYNIDNIRTNIREIIETEVEKNCEEFNRLPIEEQHKERILAAAKANWSVFYKNFVDNINSAIITSVLDNVNEWVNNILIQDEKIRLNTAEDRKVKTQRIECKKTIKIMKECKQILIQ